ncbi:MAG: hypothetical protein AB1689_23620 [Thermodesulfobacteriota bacterium]
MRSASRTLAVAVLLAVLAAGCSVTSTKIYGSDGKPYVYVDCNGLFQTLDDCYVAASEACPAGYRIVNGVAPRANPFGNLIVDCTDAGTTRTAPPPSTQPADEL